MVLQACNVINEIITNESEACFNTDERADVLESKGEAEGARSGDYEKAGLGYDCRSSKSAGRWLRGRSTRPLPVASFLDLIPQKRAGPC